jgi:hypothetical protein
MPVDLGVWKIEKGTQPKKVEFLPFEAEDRLEEIISRDISILDPRLLLIGRQVPTAFGKFIDLLAIDADGQLYVVELKRNLTPREVVAQLLDYGSWVRTLAAEDIAAIYANYLRKYQPKEDARGLDDAFREAFGGLAMPEELNESHELVVVAGALDASTERIVSYLAEHHGVAINAVFFRFYKDGANEFLSRIWLNDPSEIDEGTTDKKGGANWNGEFYVSFGEGPNRRWEDARKHGYIAAGGGSWYSNTLLQLEPGNRIWVNVPGCGYVGVAIVTASAVPITDFKLPDGRGNLRPLKEFVPNSPSDKVPADELEYYVKVDWIKTVSLDEAIKEKGFFGNQNSVAKPKVRKWDHTVSRLRQRLGIKD